MGRKPRLLDIDGVIHHHCGRCGEYKTPSEFYKNSRALHGTQAYCKPCVREYAGTGKWSEWRKERYYRDPARTIWIEARTRARKQALPFDIEPSDCSIPEFCPVLGLRLLPKGNGTHTDATPTLDKVEPSKGYVKGNVNVISWKANRLKSNCDEPETFESIAAYIRANKGQT